MTFETRVRIRNPPCQPHNVQAEEPQRMLRGRGNAHPASPSPWGCCIPGVLPSTPAFPACQKISLKHEASWQSCTGLLSWQP